MNTQTEASPSMSKAVKRHCDDNPSIIAPLPAFPTAFDAFKPKIAEINNITRVSDLSLTNITADKANRKQNSVQIAADTAGIIYAFTSATNNNTLKQAVKFPLSKLLQTRAKQLARRCQNMHAKSIANLATLADYGIPAKKLADLQAKIDNFTMQIPKPRTARADRAVKTTNLNDLFRESKKFLKQTDDLVDNFAAAHTEVVNKYKRLRKIDKPPSTTTQLKDKVTNKSDGTAINQAEITLTEAAKTANTDSLGNYSIKPAPIGKFTIRVSKPGFNDFEIFDFDIKLGEITTLNVELVSI